MSTEHEHEQKYRKMARDKHITITGEESLQRFFGVRDKAHLRQLIAEDEHLNNIPLRKFDRLTEAFNMYHPDMRMTLAEGTSLYKRLLRDYAAGEGQFNTTLSVEAQRRMGLMRRRGVVHVQDYTRRRYYIDEPRRGGHRVWVGSEKWPSQVGMSHLRRHRKRFHPRAFRASIRKGVATRKTRRSHA